MRAVETFGDDAVNAAQRRTMSWFIVVGRLEKLEKAYSINGWRHTFTTRAILTRILDEGPPMADLVGLKNDGLVVRLGASTVDHDRIRELWLPIASRGGWV